MAEKKPTSTSRWNIKITEELIEKAERRNSYGCVVTNAIAVAIPDAHHIETDIQTIRFTRDGERFAYLTPYTVQGYIVAFDAGEAIQPFSFQLRDPKRLRRRVKTAAGKDLDRAHSEKKRAKKSVARTQARATEPKDEVKALRAAYKEVAKSKTDDGEYRAPPRVHKFRKRVYGSRVLRINREAVE